MTTMIFLLVQAMMDIVRQAHEPVADAERLIQLEADNFGT